MLSPISDAWPRLPWRQWIARGVLLGLCAGIVLALAVLINAREVLEQRHPSLAPGWWLYVALNAGIVLALAAVMSRLRHVLKVTLLIGAGLGLCEAMLIGVGPNLLRIPFALALVIAAERWLGPARPD